ncbi:hypothetical protein JCM21900_000361 [Sporobolomyces salmonicolor]
MLFRAALLALLAVSATIVSALPATIINDASTLPLLASSPRVVGTEPSHLPPAGSDERLKLALGQRADQFKLSGVAAPVLTNKEAARPPTVKLDKPLVLNASRMVVRSGASASAEEGNVERRSPKWQVKERRGKRLRRMRSEEAGEA